MPRSWVVPCLCAAALAASTGRALGQAGFFQRALGSSLEQVVDRAKLDLMSRGHGAENGLGPVPYLPALTGPPRRIGLVSYYTLDVSRVDREGLEPIAQALHDAGVPAMREAFSSHGMQLLTPAEFLDTAEKQAAYEAFRLDPPAAHGHGVAAAAGGYRMLELPRLNVGAEKRYGLALQGGSVPVFQALGHDFARALGVDAVLIVYHVLRAEQRGTNMIGSYAYMFGPNPIPFRDATPYWKGHQYTGTWIKLEVPLLRSRGGDEVEQDFAGSSLVARALAERTARHLEAEIAGR